MKPAMMVISAILIILLMRSALTSINNFRMASYAEPHIVATVSPDTSGNVTLTQALYNSSVVNAVVTSPNTNDAPLSALYTSSTKVLWVQGLETNQTRTLTVTYKIDALTDYLGAAAAVVVWPLFLILGVIGIIAGAVFTAMKNRD